MRALRVNIERALKGTWVQPAAIDQILEEVRDSLWLAQVQVAAQAEVLRQAAEGWGDGNEGFPHGWLNDRADEIEQGKSPDWSQP
jgi:hypothetical protein